MLQEFLDYANVTMPTHRKDGRTDGLKLECWELEKAYRGVWGDNADDVSVVYSGTQALKRDYTRTGKRTALGKWNDGVNSVRRFYGNNLVDGRRQEAVDLLIRGREGGAEEDTHMPEEDDVAPRRRRRRRVNAKWLAPEVEVSVIAALARNYSRGEARRIEAAFDRRREWGEKGGENPWSVRRNGGGKLGVKAEMFVRVGVLFGGLKFGVYNVLAAIGLGIFCLSCCSTRS